MLSKQLRLKPSEYSRVRAVVYMPGVLAGIARKAQGLDISNVISSANLNRFNMVNCKFYITSSTAKTPVSVVVTKLSPLFGGVVPPISLFPCLAAMIIGGNPVGMILLPFASRRPSLIPVFYIIFAAILGHFIGIRLSVTFPIFANPFRVFVSPLPGSLTRPFYIVVPVLKARLPDFVPVILIVFIFPFLYLVPVPSIEGAVIFPSAFNTAAALVPLVCATLATRFSHQKSPFALVAKEALKYTSFVTSAYNTCRHALGTLARSPGFSFFDCPIIPQVVR